MCNFRFSHRDALASSLSRSAGGAQVFPLETGLPYAGRRTTVVRENDGMANVKGKVRIDIETHTALSSSRDLELGQKSHNVSRPFSGGIGADPM
jgi:hypothetical protein